MKLGFDATAARNQTAGIGRYAREILTGAQRSGSSDVSVFYTGSAREGDVVDEYARNTMIDEKSIPIPERALNTLWHRVGIQLTIEKFIGTVDLIHGPDFLVPPSAAPSIATIHDLTWEVVPQCAHPALKRYLETAVPRSIERAQHLIAVSDTTRSDIIERYGVQPRKVTTIHNGVNHQFFSEEDPLAAETCSALGIEGPYFLTVGTLEPRKNHTTLIRAFAEFHRNNPEFSLVIAGRSGWLSEPIHQAIADAKSRGISVVHVQHADDHQLRALYQRALGFVYPSWYEGFGLPILEAMASRTPVIASDIPVHREIAGDAALFAPARSLEALIAEIRSLAESDTTRARLVKRGAERAQTFGWASSVEKHLSLYEEVAFG